MADPVRFRVIDDLTRPTHSHLTEDDECIYLWEKTSHRDYSFSDANQLVANIKKNPATSSAGERHFKRRDMGKCSRALKKALNPEWLKDAVLVPIPPSKAADHLEYDDRMERICSGIGVDVDVRNLVIQNSSMDASHERGQGERITVDQLLGAYSIDESLSGVDPVYIGIVDDVLTAGTHYRAMHTVLSARFPSTKITGIFIARRIFPDDDF